MAVAEILGISSSSVTPVSVSGVTTPGVTSQVENDEHEHLTVSSKSVADYFKEKMRHVFSKPLGPETEVDEVSRGGIGSRLNSCDYGEVEEGGGLRGGLGMRLLARMSVTEAVTVNSVQEETPEGKGKGEREREKRKCRSKDNKGEAGCKPKRGYQKVQTVSD